MKCSSSEKSLLKPQFSVMFFCEKVKFPAITVVQGHYKITLDCFEICGPLCSVFSLKKYVSALLSRMQIYKIMLLPCDTFLINWDTKLKKSMFIFEGLVTIFINELSRYKSNLKFAIAFCWLPNDLPCYIFSKNANG